MGPEGDARLGRVVRHVAQRVRRRSTAHGWSGMGLYLGETRGFKLVLLSLYVYASPSRRFVADIGFPSQEFAPLSVS